MRPDPRPHATLGRVLDHLGSTLLRPGSGAVDPDRRIEAVLIHDPTEDQPPPAHGLVLGVGLGDLDAVAEVLDRLGRYDVAALVVRGPLATTPEVGAAAARAGVPVLALTPGASWVQMTTLLRSLLRDDDVAPIGADTLGGTPTGDLFAVANAISALLDAPITIEDRGSRVLAFSGGQDEADESRIETILGRQVPERYFRYLTDRGVFAQLYSSTEPVHVAPTDGPEVDFSLARVAIGVRAGDEVLGSIWAAVREPLSPERTRAMQEAATLVALHLLRLRAGADVDRRLHAELLSTALEGGAGAGAALARLQLERQPVVVLALGVLEQAATAGSSGSTDRSAHRAVLQERASDAWAVHLSAIHPRSAVAMLGDVTYGVLPVTRGEADAGARAVATAGDFISRVGDRLPVAVGVGPVAEPGAGLVVSRAGAASALRVLQHRADGPRAARFEDVHAEVVLADLADLTAARGWGVTGPVAALVRYDEENDQALVPTLRAWFDAFGDVRDAAERLFVHPNTFRYRLRRVREVAGLDLDDPDARLAAMVQLRMMQYLGPRPGRDEEDR